MHPYSLRAVDNLPIAMATLSVGRASKHELRPKLKAIAKAGFHGVELFYEDIKLPSLDMPGIFEQNLITEARMVRKLCDCYGLTITCLQPFKNYEGLLSRERHAEKITKLKNWLLIASALRTDLIMLPSMFHTDPLVSTGDEATIVADLQEIAGLGAAHDPPIRFAYEAMAWGAHVSTWQDAWRIVQKVDKSNVGLCLDTFQVLGKIWADPTVAGGKLDDADAILSRDCKQFLSNVPLDKVFYVQIADGLRLDQPISPSHPWYDPKQHPVLTWSRNARLFPGENDIGAFLPVFDLLKVWLIDLGYRGPIGIEVFNRSLFSPEHTQISKHAKRGIESWRKCVEALGLDKVLDIPDHSRPRLRSDTNYDVSRL